MRIAGIDIPDNKRGEIALTYIYGLGRSSAIKILNEAGISVDKKVSEWTEEESNKIRNIISSEFIRFPLNAYAHDVLYDKSVTCWTF